MSKETTGSKTGQGMSEGGIVGGEVRGPGSIVTLVWSVDLRQGTGETEIGGPDGPGGRHGVRGGTGLRVRESVWGLTEPGTSHEGTTVGYPFSGGCWERSP